MEQFEDPSMVSIHGTANPSSIIEKITRLRIYSNAYWKEKCFGLTAETLVDRAIELKWVGGNYSANLKPTPFLCLVCKMLVIQPEPAIVFELLKQQDHKYVRALGALYLRLTGKAVDIYTYLEPLYNDNRKLRKRGIQGWSLVTMDSFAEELVMGTHCCDIALPRLAPRFHLEKQGLLKPYTSLLDDEFKKMQEEEEEKKRKEEEEKKKKEEKEKRSRRRYRSRSRDRSRRRYRSRSRDRSRRRYRSRSNDRSRRRYRSRSDSRERRHKKEEKKKSKEKEEAPETKKMPAKGTIEYWNMERAKLGLKPLKE
eukprot:g4129.t1